MTQHVTSTPLAPCRADPRTVRKSAKQGQQDRHLLLLLRRRRRQLAFQLRQLAFQLRQLLLQGPLLQERHGVQRVLRLPQLLLEDLRQL